MRLVQLILVAAIGCGGTQPKPDDGPGTQGVVDDSGSDDIQIAKATPEKMCVDIATLRPSTDNQPSLPLYLHDPALANAPTDRLLASLGVDDDDGDMVTTIVGVVEIGADIWAFVYTRCGALPTCTSYLARAERDDSLYSITKSDLELEAPVADPRFLTPNIFATTDANGDGNEELWLALSTATDVGGDGVEMHTYLAAYSIPDMLPLMWTHLVATPPRDDTETERCTVDTDFHDLNCDTYLDILVSKTCGPADSPSLRREALVWKPEHGTYFLSEHSWTPDADAPAEGAN